MKPLSSFILAAVLFSTGSLSAYTGVDEHTLHTTEHTMPDFMATTHALDMPMQPTTHEALMPHTETATATTHHTAQHHVFTTHVTMIMHVTQPDMNTPPHTTHQVTEPQVDYATTTHEMPAHSASTVHGAGSTEAMAETTFTETENEYATTTAEGTTVAMVFMPHAEQKADESGVHVQQPEESNVSDEEQGMYESAWPQVSQASPTPSFSEVPPSQVISTPTEMGSVSPTHTASEAYHSASPSATTTHLTSVKHKATPSSHIVTPTPSISSEVKALETENKQQSEGGMSTWQYALIAALCLSVGGAVFVVLSKVVKRHRDDRRRFARLRNNEDNMSFSGDSNTPMHRRF